MKIILNNIIEIFLREIKIIRHDVNITSVILLAPLFYSFFYTSVYFNKVENKIPVSVVDMDKTHSSKELIRNLNNHRMINIFDDASDFETAKRNVYSEKSQAIVFIPNNFEADLKKGLGSTIKIYLNTNRFLASNDLNKAINETVGTLNAGIKLNFFQTAGFSREQSLEMIEPISIDMRSLFNFTESYGDFLIPGLLALIIQQTLLIGLGESIAKEREENTIYKLKELANGNSFTALKGKTSFYFILFISYAVFFYTINFSVFSLNFKGSYLLLFLLTILFILSVIGLSVFVSSFFKRKIISLQVFAFTSLPAFLMSGYSWPSSAMPDFVKYIAMLVPSTPFLNGYIRITQMGAGFGEIYTVFIHLIIMTLFWSAAAMFRFKKLFKESGKAKTI